MGVSKVVSSLNSLHCTRVGTPLYLAPELIKQIPYDFKVDIWSVGCSLYHLCALEPPFLGENSILLGNSIIKNEPKQINNIYTKELWIFITLLLNKKPDERPNTNKCYEFFPDKIIASYKEKIRILNAKKQKEEKMKKMNTQSIAISENNDDILYSDNILDSINSNTCKFQPTRLVSNTNMNINGNANINMNANMNSNLEKDNKKERVKSAIKIKTKDSKFIDYFENSENKFTKKINNEDTNENYFNINLKNGIKDVKSNDNLIESTNNIKVVKEKTSEKNELNRRSNNNEERKIKENEKIINEDNFSKSKNMDGNIMETNLFPDLGLKDNFTKLEKNNNERQINRPKTAFESVSKFNQPFSGNNRILSGKTRPFTALKSSKLNKNKESNNIINININLYNIDFNTLQMLNPKYLKPNHTSNILFVDNRHVKKDNNHNNYQNINGLKSKYKEMNNNLTPKNNTNKKVQSLTFLDSENKKSNFEILETKDIDSKNVQCIKSNIFHENNISNNETKELCIGKSSNKYVPSKFKKDENINSNILKSHVNSKSKEKNRPLTSKPIIMKELPKPSVVLSKLDNNNKNKAHDDNTISSTFRNNNNFNGIINSLIKRTLSRTSSKLTVNEFINIK